MTTYYLAGPMRGIDQFNFPAFDRHQALLEAQGFTVFSPAEHDRDLGFDETLNSLDGWDFAAAFQWDAESVIAADAVAVIAGWERSRGARLEVELARMLGKPVVHADNLTVLSSFEMRAARSAAEASDYLDLTAAQTTGGVPA